MGVAIIDYGVGNLRSVEKACSFAGGEASVTNDPTVIEAASHVILPGVGAFAEAMRRLREAGLEQAVRDVARSGKPMLGICVGMQMLFARSEEHGAACTGLGLIEADITRLDAPGLKVPQIGWNDLTLRESPLFAGLSERPYVYFVHSYCAQTVTSEYVIASAVYGKPFIAAVRQGNVYGTQFHPEKSGEAGLRILRNFMAL